MTILTCNKGWSAYHFKYFQNNPILKLRDHTNPPDLPTLKAYPTPAEGGRFEIFSLKWGEKMNLKVPGAILSLWLRVFEHWGENCFNPPSDN